MRERNQFPLTLVSQGLGLLHSQVNHHFQGFSSTHPKELLHLAPERFSPSSSLTQVPLLGLPSHTIAPPLVPQTLHCEGSYQGPGLLLSRPIKGGVDGAQQSYWVQVVSFSVFDL